MAFESASSSVHSETDFLALVLGGGKKKDAVRKMLDYSLRYFREMLCCLKWITICSVP